MPKGAMRRTASRFLSTPSARRATRCRPPWQCRGSYFYPRPPRGGRQHGCHKNGNVAQNFYPRPPRGGRHGRAGGVLLLDLFLSTPSARRATCRKVRCAEPLQDFYPRPPRGGRHVAVHRGNAVGVISIHALREEGDALTLEGSFPADIFLSTPSARRATRFCRCMPSPAKYFYPRPPRGGRRGIVSAPTAAQRFLSTPSARRAT